METVPRHQCLVYDGPEHLPLHPLAMAMRERLAANTRCLYLNSPPLVAEMRLRLAAAGVDVSSAEANGSLILSSERPQLVHDKFEVRVMLGSLEVELVRALKDGFAGLWASGDLTWQLGPDPDVVKLIEYERRLDAFLSTHKEIAGVCEYHTGSLPNGTEKLALLMHPGVFVDETLSHANGEYREAMAAD